MGARSNGYHRDALPACPFSPPANDKARIAVWGNAGLNTAVMRGVRGTPPGFDQPNTRKRSASSMKALSPKPASFEPNGICARSFQ